MEPSKILAHFPDMSPNELASLQSFMNEMSDRQADEFVQIYRGKRRDRQTMGLLAALGFFGIAGIHRFLAGDVVMGIVYFLTLGFCWIGTIVDLVNIGSFTDEFNRKQAIEAAQLVRMIQVP